MKASKHAFLVSMLSLTSAISGTAIAQSLPGSSAATRPGGASLDRLIEMVARKSGRTFVVDPRVPENVQLIGEDASAVTYDELVSILDVYGFAAVDSGRLVRIVPQAFVRSEGLPLISNKDKRPDAEFVSTVVHVKSLSAAMLVPVLRPLVPPYGDLAALPCANALILVDRFVNVRRIEAIIRDLDVGTPLTPQSCEPGNNRHSGPDPAAP